MDKKEKFCFLENFKKNISNILSAFKNGQKTESQSALEIAKIAIACGLNLLDSTNNNNFFWDYLRNIEIELEIEYSGDFWVEILYAYIEVKYPQND